MGIFDEVRAVPKPNKQRNEKPKPKYKEKRPNFTKKSPPKKKTKRFKKEDKIPSMNTRKKFSRHVKEQAIEFFDGLCANCRARPPVDPHHIRFKSADPAGKGVFTNCLPVCRECHRKIHNNAALAQHWKEWAKKQWGYDYWMDEWDKEAKRRENFYKGVMGDA